MKLLLLIFNLFIPTYLSQNIGYFWHVTDFHLDKNYSMTVKQKSSGKEYFLGDYAYEICWGKAGGKYGDYNCDASEELVKSAVDFVKAKSESLQNVSFILWTG